MLDLAWLGPGEGALLIEVNPLMEGLGSFKGSTGLFDFYADGEKFVAPPTVQYMHRRCRGPSLRFV